MSVLVLSFYLTKITGKTCGSKLKRTSTFITVLTVSAVMTQEQISKMVGSQVGTRNSELGTRHSTISGHGTTSTPY
jgi:hypothetical protein